MKRTVSVIAAGSGATADVRLDATRTVGEVLPQLMRLTGSTVPTITRDGTALDPGLPVAHLHDGDVLVLTDSPRPALPATARVEVVAGPDAGTTVDLPPGRWLVGRDGDALSLTDALVSRHHFRNSTSRPTARVMVTDLGSTNGTRLYDADVGARQQVSWPAGAVLRCGTTSLVHGRTWSPAATAVRPDGTTIVNRPPRLDTGQPRQGVVFPAPPPPATTGRLPLLASLAPLLAGVVLALVMHRWEFLAFAVMSPLVVLGQALTDRWGARRANRAAARDHAAAVAAAEAQLADTLADETRRRHERAPDLAALVHAATDRTTLLWHRGKDDGDALTVRLGLGALPSDVEIQGDRVVPTLEGVPVCVDLLASRVLGLCGDGADALARSLVTQATTLLGPADLALTVLAPDGGTRWAWARWLPHTSLASTREQVRAHIDRLSARSDDDSSSSWWIRPTPSS